MKSNIILSGMALALLSTATGCADQTIDIYNVDKPEELSQYEYLNAYGNLKDYIHSTRADINPEFKLGIALSVDDYLKYASVYRLANANFDAVTCGNAMKPASFIADDGTMSFEKISTFLDAASEKGIDVFGHTIAWQSQAPKKWLESLLKPAVPDTPAEAQDVEVGGTDFADYTKFPFYVMGYEPEIVDGRLHSCNPTEWHQYFIADGITTIPGETYKVVINMEASKEGEMNVQFGDWSGMQTKVLMFKEGANEYTIPMDGSQVTANSSFVIVQPGTFDGDIWIESVKVLHSEVVESGKYVSIISNGDAETAEDLSCFYSTEKTVGPNPCIIGGAGTGADGQGHAFVVKSGDNPANTWDTQFFIKTNRQLNVDDKVRVSFKYRADHAAECETQAHKEPGTYNHWQMLVPTPSFTTDWQENTWEFTVGADHAAGGYMQTIAFNLNVDASANTYYFDDVKFEIYQTSNEYTPEEKTEILAAELEREISAMMAACDGRVKAWDAVNEPISGSDRDGDGFYDLWSADNCSAEDQANWFIWGDNYGKDYPRKVVELARKYGPEDIKLFINDYNLESDWDDNRKVKSLIHWIEYWESDGVTRIDGIASQMHISCYADPEILAGKKRGIEEMLRLMAATGKLVKISELDMGYVGNDGSSVKTTDLTFEQSKEMAELYRWVIEKYFEIVPTSQQFGITQWCITDSPEGSGWRGGEPVGLWDLNFKRKPTYGGFADGLRGEGSVITE